MHRTAPGARRPALVAAAAALLPLLPLLVAAPPAAAAPAASATTAAVWSGGAPAASGSDRPTGYRYWSFWLRDADDADDGGAWRYATEGPGTLRPADGTVLGFRFGIGTGAGGAEQPRGEETFATVCDQETLGEGEGEGEGERRVALVLDFGTPGEAPAGEVPPHPATACAVVADGATAAEALASVADPLRYDRSGLLCAVRGYPERGCGEQASVAPEDSPAAGEDNGDDGDATGSGGDGVPGGTGLWFGIAAVAVLATAALARGRRRER